MKGSITLPTVRVEMCVASKEEVRCYLQWPYLDLREPDAPMIVATDGHKLIAAPVQVNGDLESCPLPLAAFEYARRNNHRMEFDGEMCGTSEAMFKLPAREFKYPNWRNVTKDAPIGKPDVGINATSLDTIHRAFGENRYHGITLALTYVNGKTNPAGLVRVRAMSANNDEDVVAVIMPMRIE